MTLANYSLTNTPSTQANSMHYTIKRESVCVCVCLSSYVFLHPVTQSPDSQNRGTNADAQLENSEHDQSNVHGCQQTLK